jgi:cytochrome oxidase Cu insertion factor (SCO1/SenC/PrrC family)
MNDLNSETQGTGKGWPVLAGLALVVLLLAGVFVFAGLKLRHAGEKPLPVYGQIADFTLTDENGRTVTLADLRGQVWVADIIFTRCAGPCPIMTRHMKELQDALPVGSKAKLVTLTTDPDFDTPPVMKTYAERFGADTNRWMFLTGTKPQIRNLAVDSLKLSAVAKKPDEQASPQDLFVHSTIFVVVDSQARLRGIFESTGDGIDPRQQESRIVAAVAQLEREE